MCNSRYALIYDEFKEGEIYEKKINESYDNMHRYFIYI